MQIEQILNTLTVDKLGRIRGKNRAINTLHRLHLLDIEDNYIANPENEVQQYMRMQKKNHEPMPANYEKTRR